MASNSNFDLIVIGAGPAGYVGAIRAAQLGLKVACIEKDKTLGGTCLNVGCIPSKALLESSELYSQAQHQFNDHGILCKDVSLDFKALMDRKEKVVRQLTSGVAGLFLKNKITSIQGQASFTTDRKVKVQSTQTEQILSAPKILIATGSTPISIPAFPIDHQFILDSTDALALKSIPKTLAVIGGGYIGLELGSVYARLGSQVTVVEAFDRIVPAMDFEIGKLLQKSLQKQGLAFQLSTKVVKAKVQADSVELTLDQAGSTSTLTVEKVLVAIGRKPLTQGLGLENVGISLDARGRIKTNEKFETTAAQIYAVGDVIAGPMLAHKASEEAIAAVEIMVGQAGHVNYNTIPSVIYTWPEVASVGLTEEQAKEKQIPYKVFKYPFIANGRALALGEKEGTVKLLAHKTTDRLLGAHLIGPRTSDLIAEIVLGMEFSTSAEDVARTVHAHPTLAEAIKEAALGLGSGAIHI